MLFIVKSVCEFIDVYIIFVYNSADLTLRNTYKHMHML